MDDRARLETRELSRAWQGVLGRLELEVNPHNFTTWLKGTRAVSFAAGQLVIEARSSEYMDRVMRIVIERAAGQAFEGVQSVTFVAPGQPATVPTEDVPVAVSTAAPVHTPFLHDRPGELLLHVDDSQRGAQAPSQNFLSCSTPDSR